MNSRCRLPTFSAGNSPTSINRRTVGRLTPSRSAACCVVDIVARGATVTARPDPSAATDLFERRMHLRRQLHLIMLTGTDQQIPRLDPVTAAPLVRVEEADHRRQPRTLHRLREIRVLIQRLRTHDRTTSRPNYRNTFRTFE